MSTRAARTAALALIACVIGCVIGASFVAPPAHARYTNIQGLELKQVFTDQTCGTSTNVTSTAFTPLGATNNQSAQFRALGTSPNYKVEVFVMVDGTNFVKPETGGDLGTFSDNQLHVVPITVPVCQQFELVLTNLSGANAISDADAWVLAQ